jgi:hypothetical protein
MLNYFTSYTYYFKNYFSEVDYDGISYEYKIIIGMRALVCFDSVPVISPIIILQIVGFLFIVLL